MIIEGAVTSAGIIAGEMIAVSAATTGFVLGMVIPMSPKTKNVVKFVAGATFVAPFLAAEDLLRATGVKVPEKGVLYNDEGKSIWQVWNEAAA